VLNAVLTISYARNSTVLSSACRAELINTVASFQVSEDTITTSASCKEAHCKAGNPGDFMYCSGGTCKHMNVTLVLSMVLDCLLHCGIVNVDWATVFPE